MSKTCPIVASELAKWLCYSLLFVLLCHCFMQPTLLFANSTHVIRESHSHVSSAGTASDKLLQREHHGLPQEQAAADGTGVRLVTQEVRYRLPEADEVFLVWGINGWSVVSAAVRPAGTVLHNGVMLTPMAPAGKRFVGKVQVPPGTAINYGFLITPKHHDTSTNPIWDGKPDYHRVVTQENVIEVPAAQTPAKSPRLWLQLLLGISIVVGIGATLKRTLRTS